LDIDAGFVTIDTVIVVANTKITKRCIQYL